MDYRFDVIAWGIVLSVLAICAAFAAEGRGVHLLRLLLGLTPKNRGLDLLGSVPRDEGDWRVIDKLSEIDAVSERDRVAADRAGRSVERSAGR